MQNQNTVAEEIPCGYTKNQWNLWQLYCHKMEEFAKLQEQMANKYAAAHLKMVISPNPKDLGKLTSVCENLKETIGIFEKL